MGEWSRSTEVQVEYKRLLYFFCWKRKLKNYPAFSCLQSFDMRPHKAIGKLPSSEKVRLYYATSVKFIPGHVEGLIWVAEHNVVVVNSRSPTSYNFSSIVTTLRPMRNWRKVKVAGKFLIGAIHFSFKLTGLEEKRTLGDSHQFPVGWNVVMFDLIWRFPMLNFL